MQDASSSEPRSGATAPGDVDAVTRTELRDIAQRLARSAGDVAAEGRRKAHNLVGDSERVTTKSSAADLVTEFDRAAEREIVAWLSAHRPRDGIVGEEGSSTRSQSGLEWHIDPIDGTTNFVFDQPAWACSIAVTSERETLAGAVYIPRLNEMFSAASGLGAHLNGEAIMVNTNADPALPLVATGFSFDANRRREQGRLIADLVGNVRDIRRLGSAAVDLCFVACGRSDAYFETGLNSWDMLAGNLIAIEAGARSSSFDGGTPTPKELLVATPSVHDALIALLAPWAGR